MKDLKIEIPSGYVIDEENSNLLQGVIKFKKIEIKTFYDLVKSKQKVNWSWIGYDSVIYSNEYDALDECDKNVFIDEKHAKSALAMAQISQLMPYYGGAITYEEWLSSSRKYTISRLGVSVDFGTSYNLFNILAFHTEWQRNDFYNENERLVKDYLMID